MKYITYILVGIIAAAGVAAILHSSAKPQRAVEPNSQGVMQLMNAGQAALPVSAQPTQIISSTPPLEKAQTKRELVASLSKSKNPTDQFLAYRMIRACVAARNDDLLVADRVAQGGKPRDKSSLETCGDIDAGQIAGRRQLLNTAANAGVHHAASSLADEGATGEGYAKDADMSAADQQQFQVEMKRAIEAGAANGDWWSLAAVASSQEASASTTGDYQGALKNLEDANQAYKEETGHDMKSYAENKGRLTYFSNKAKSQ